MRVYTVHTKEKEGEKGGCVDMIFHIYIYIYMNICVCVCVFIVVVHNPAVGRYI
jgi:hypothetical protein